MLYINKHFLPWKTINALTAVTKTKQRYEEKWPSKSYAIQTDSGNSWQGIWDHTWVYRGTNKKADRQKHHFSTYSLTSHFEVIMVLWALNRARSQKRGKQTFFSDLLWSSKPSKATQSSLSHKATWTWLKLPTCQLKLVTSLKESLLGNVTKTGNSFSLPLTGVYVKSMWLKRPLTLRLRTAK